MRIILFTILLYISVYPQISPGDLTTFHSKLEGISNCTKCHVIGKQVSNSKCLTCHTEINERINSGTGFHSSAEVKGKTCCICHSEHHGKNFRIINFNKDSFDHNKTNFKLTGKHSTTQCNNCHQSKFTGQTAISNRKNSYLGLNTRCFSCHEDIHQNTLSNQCENCHNSNSFIPASNFNHNNTRFKLLGAHGNLDCTKCHPKAQKSGRNFQMFKGVTFASCANCHKDVHLGKFGADCKSCHEVSSFKKVNQKIFDHDKTNYPLIGKHRILACQDCHKNNLNSKPKYQKCVNCHSDFHNGDFLVKGELIDCKECHDLNGYRPALYSIEKHSQTRFELTGSHLAVPCQNCHLINTKWHFKNLGMNCIDCHKNVHGNELTSKFMPDNDCKTCHQTNNWYNIKYDHNLTTFKLSGKHLSVACSKCHHNTSDGSNEYKFASTKSECFNCHKDIHMGQFKDVVCQECHGFNSWKMEAFDHNNTGFPLGGAHAKLSCGSCHKKSENNGITFIKYKMESFKCAACHS
jgi:hypothetical protein